MSRAKHHPSRYTSERGALRRRIKQMYECFNRGHWEKCYSLVDPKLRAGSRVRLSPYAALLQAFKEVYGSIDPWHIRINLHLEVSANKQDQRPFAYIYFVWQDETRAFHLFKERWVKDSGHWFTRVVGLVPNQKENQG